MDSVLVAAAGCVRFTCVVCVCQARRTLSLSHVKHTQIKRERERVCASVRELAAQLSGESVGREIVCRAAAARWAPVRLVW